MTCEAYEPLIALHVEGDLTAAEVAEVERHLDGCAACRAFAAEMEASQRALREHGPVTADPGVLAAVRASVLAEIEHDRAAPARPWWEVSTRQLALAASLVLVVGAALLLLRRDPLGRLEPLPGPAPEAPAPRTRAEPPAVVAGAPAPEPVPELPAEPVVTASAPLVRAEPASPAVESAPPPPAAPGPPLVRPAIRTPDPEPMVIKLVSDDPDLVIYWLVDPEPEKETDHETATT